MSLCFKLAPIVSYWEEYCESMQSWLLSEVWNIKTPNLAIFKRENPKNSEPQNGPRRGLDFIALKKHTWGAGKCVGFLYLAPSCHKYSNFGPPLIVGHDVSVHCSQTVP